MPSWLHPRTRLRVYARSVVRLRMRCQKCQRVVYPVRPHRAPWYVQAELDHVAGREAGLSDHNNLRVVCGLCHVRGGAEAGCVPRQESPPSYRDAVLLFQELDWPESWWSRRLSVLLNGG